MGKWISVKERLPRYDEWVLVVSGGHTQEMAARLFPHASGDRWEWASDECDTAPVSEMSHWMPLPAPPKGEQ